MRIIRTLLLALALTTPVVGCASVNKALDVVNIATTSIVNPVTPEMVYDLHNAGNIALAGLNAYRASCKQELIPPSCNTVLAHIRVYTRPVPQMMRQLRAFVRDNDQISAIKVYGEISNLIANAKATAAQNNVGGL